jgi:hypothetical protein
LATDGALCVTVASFSNGGRLDRYITGATGKIFIFRHCYPTINYTSLSSLYIMKKQKGPAKPSKGPSQALVSRIDHLRTLLSHLPETLPLNPENSTYHFGIDEERVEERGVLGAFSHNMEICFRTFERQDSLGLRFTERGDRVLNLVTVMKSAVKKMSEAERSAFKDAWLERFITAATASGAKIPPRPKRKASASTLTDKLQPAKKAKEIVISSDSEPEADSPPSRDIVMTVPVALESGPAVSRPRVSIPQTLKQSTLDGSLKRLTEAEKAAASKRDRREREDALQEAQEREEQQREKAKQRKLELNRERQRRFRKNHEGEETTKKTKNKQGVNDVLMRNAADAPSGSQLATVAETSRASKEAWRNGRNGTQGGAKEEHAVRTNYFHPFLWLHVDKSMRKAGWSVATAEKMLKREHPTLFHNIHRGTIWKWKKKDENMWTDKTLASVERGHALQGTGRAGALSKVPEVVKDIAKILKSLRSGGVAVQIFTARAVILQVINKKAPEVLNDRFRCSERFVHTFLASVMDWSLRAATRAAAHIPTDAPDLCERTFFRIVYAMKWETVPPKLVVNMDQMGVYVLPNNALTYNKIGEKQVDVVAKDEKRAFTLCVASTPSGTLLPFQQIWGGKTAGVLPTMDAARMEEALDRGFVFSAASSEKNPRSHFSTLKTMKEWVENIMVPYVRRIVEEDGLEDDQKAILLLDAYPVHTGEAFRAYVFEDHPNIVLLFIPANCTGIFQPADVGLQRPTKHILKRELFQYIVDYHQSETATGVAAEDVKISTSYPVLRNASVAGLVTAYDFMQTVEGQDLIKKVRWTVIYFSSISPFTWNLCNRRGQNARPRNGPSQRPA